MGNFSGGEMMLVLFLALLVLGPERLPRVARQAGQWIGKARHLSEGFQSEVRRAMDDPMSMGDVPFEQGTKPNRAVLAPDSDRQPTEGGAADQATTVPDVSGLTGGEGDRFDGQSSADTGGPGDDTPRTG